MSVLTSIRIQNFRSCQDVRIDGLGAVTALVGRNGAGKTNILQAILKTATIATSREGIQLSDVLSTTDPFSVILRFAADGTNYEYSLALKDSRQTGVEVAEQLLRVNNDGGYKLFNRLGTNLNLGGSGSLKIEALTPAIITIRQMLPESNPIAAAARDVDLFLRKVRYYPLSEGREDDAKFAPISQADYEAWATSYEATRNPEDSVALKIIYLSQERPEDFSALQSLLGPDGLRLVDKIELSSLWAVAGFDGGQALRHQHFWLSFCIGHDLQGKPKSVALDGLSLGTRRVLKMLVALIFDRSSVLLIEQPEDGLHPSLTRALIGILRQNAYPSQIILSSHSPVLLNQLAPHEVQLISLHDGSTTARSLDDQELKVAEDFINEDGPLSDFLESVEAD